MDGIVSGSSAVSHMRRHAMVLASMVFAVALAALLWIDKVAGQDGEWEIVRAEYGIRSRHVDVTEIVRRLLWEGRQTGRVPVNNQTMGGDPAVGADKSLHIIAQNRRHDQREFEFREGMWIDVTMFSLRPEQHQIEVRREDDRRDDARRNDDFDRDRPRDDDDRGRADRLRIVRAYWGAQGQMVNVTDMVRGMVRGGMLQVHVDNVALGSDPAVGRDKVLIVVYVVDGREQAASTHEGNTMHLP